MDWPAYKLGEKLASQSFINFGLEREKYHNIGLAKFKYILRYLGIIDLPVRRKEH